MHIRIPFASAFLLLLLLAGYLGLTSVRISAINDKILHFITFFVLTLSFYWILDASRRRALNLTLLVVTLILGLGSEILQAVFPNDRVFDPLDIVANMVGSLLALGICSWYHKRMLDRRRKRKGYGAVPQEGVDLELGEGGGSGQEIGIVEDEGDAWDAMEAEDSVNGEAGVTPSSGSLGDDEPDVQK